MAKKLVIPARFGFGEDRHPVKVDELAPPPHAPEDDALQLETFKPEKVKIVRPVSTERGRQILTAERFGITVPRA